MTAAIGASAKLVHVVTERDGAASWGNELPVLATPVLLWLGEIACMRAVEGHLRDGEMTVGVAHNAEHLAPTPIGWHVTMHARLAAADGRRLRFEVEATDGDEMIYRGTHDRAVLSRDRFAHRVTDKRARGRAAAEGRR